MSRILIFTIVGSLLLAVGWFAGRMGGDHTAMAKSSMNASSHGANTDERKILYWVAPMDANFRRDKPGKSPMGMDLVPFYDDQAGGNPDADVSISASIAQNLGLRTSLVTRGPMARHVETVGYTGWVESSLTMVHPRAEGWLEIFNIDSAGDRVEKGQVLFEVFSPKLVSAQREYLTARSSGNRALIRASRERLLALGITPTQVKELERVGKVMERLPYRATRTATVTDINAREGMFVTPMTNIAALADLSTIWVDVEVFESNAAWMRKGLAATARFPAYPAEEFAGEIGYVYPELNAGTRTLRLRLVFDNAEGKLRPNMFSKVSIAAAPRENVLQVPREAVIRSGAGSRVITSAGDGGFNVALVKTGTVNNSHIEILEGLAEGDRVVTSGQFLLDAEANGEQAMARLMAEKKVIPAFGVIDEFLPDNKLTISHDPVPELGWPSMTMDFVASPELRLSADMKDKPGNFSMRKKADGMWELVKFELAERSTMAESPMASEAMSHSMHGTSGPSAMTSATVVEVDSQNRRIKLDHERIQSLGMSAMTMKFNVDSDLPLEEYRSGDAVRFEVEMKPGKGMIVTKLEKQ